MHARPRHACAQAGYTDLAAFHTDRGNLALAIQHWLSARDYCATSKHTTDCNLQLAMLCALNSEPGAVGGYVSRVEATTEMLNPA